MDLQQLAASIPTGTYFALEDRIPKYSEIESKFEIKSANDLSLLWRVVKDRFQNLMKPDSMRAKRTFVTTYFDTAFWDVNTATASYRIRELADGSYLAGIKGFPDLNKKHNLLIRLEDEVKIIPGDNLLKVSFKSDKAKALTENLVNKSKTILPVFTTTVTRKSFEVIINGITVDIVFDKLFYNLCDKNKQAECISEMMYEIELEYISGAKTLGEIREAFTTVEDVLNDPNITVTNKPIPLLTSKATRGYDAVSNKLNEIPF